MAYDDRNRKYQQQPSPQQQQYYNQGPSDDYDDRRPLSEDYDYNGGRGGGAGGNIQYYDDDRYRDTIIPPRDGDVGGNGGGYDDQYDDQYDDRYQDQYDDRYRDSYYYDDQYQGEYRDDQYRDEQYPPQGQGQGQVDGRAPQVYNDDDYYDDVDGPVTPSGKGQPPPLSSQKLQADPQQQQWEYDDSYDDRTTEQDWDDRSDLKVRSQQQQQVPPPASASLGLPQRSGSQKVADPRYTTATGFDEVEDDDDENYRDSWDTRAAPVRRNELVDDDVDDDRSRWDDQQRDSWYDNQRPDSYAYDDRQYSSSSNKQQPPPPQDDDGYYDDRYDDRDYRDPPLSADRDRSKGGAAAPLSAGAAAVGGAAGVAALTSGMAAMQPPSAGSGGVRRQPTVGSAGPTSAGLDYDPPTSPMRGMPPPNQFGGQPPMPASGGAGAVGGRGIPPGIGGGVNAGYQAGGLPPGIGSGLPPGIGGGLPPGIGGGLPPGIGGGPRGPPNGRPVPSGNVLIPSTPRTSSHPTAIFNQPPKKVVKACVDYQARAVNELSFRRGDFFYVVSDAHEKYYEVTNPMIKARGQVPKDCFESLEKAAQRLNEQARLMALDPTGPPINMGNNNGGGGNNISNNNNMSNTDGWNRRDDMNNAPLSPRAPRGPGPNGPTNNALATSPTSPKYSTNQGSSGQATVTRAQIQGCEIRQDSQFWFTMEIHSSDETGANVMQLRRRDLDLYLQELVRIRGPIADSGILKRFFLLRKEKGDVETPPSVDLSKLGFDQIGGAGVMDVIEGYGGDGSVKVRVSLGGKDGVIAFRVNDSIGFEDLLGIVEERVKARIQGLSYMDETNQLIPLMGDDDLGLLIRTNSQKLMFYPNW
ncbi:bud emergence protein 1 [Blyttiomyces sp. JEL0837]|nr:bud emergence protein 1 [Blyttiomyces sp. JEL0837]